MKLLERGIVVGVTKKDIGSLIQGLKENKSLILKVTDYTCYKSGLHENGGCYSYTYSYQYVGKDKFIRTETTSCELVQDVEVEMPTAEVAKDIQHMIDTIKKKDLEIRFRKI